MPHDRGVEVHQAVHGYRDGHELIGASLRLSSGSRRTMLGLSDLSGDGTAHGFEEYLTGYPLEEEGLYVFARTWYAPEMPRPGCVWTHSLLLGAEDLESLVAPELLQSYFLRPERGRVSTTLPQFRHIEPDGLVPSAKLDGAACEMVTRLFAEDVPVLVFGAHRSQYEETCLRLWGQQWSRLRRLFAFCTGSLEPRSIEKRPFDLQVVPTQRQRRVLRAIDRYSMISDDDIARAAGTAATLAAIPSSLLSEGPIDETHARVSGSPTHAFRETCEPEYWRELLVHDLAHRNRPMREFLGAYTSDVPAKRSAHRNVIECWALLERLDAVSTSLRDVTTALTKRFPSSKDARDLKRAILGRESLIRGREPELIHELLTLPSFSALDPTDLEFEDRATQLFRSGRRWRADKTAWLLKSDQLNELGRAWASSIVDNLSTEDLANLFAEDQDLFANLLLRRPTLAATESLWKQPRELQRAAVRVLRRCPADANLPRIMLSIVRADAAALVPELVAELGRGVVQQILDAMDEAQRNGSDVDEWKWASQLRDYDAEILAWLSQRETPTPRMLAFSVALVGSHNNRLANTPSETFVRHLRDHSEPDPEGAIVDFASYCLAIALRNFNGDAGPLAATAFHFVHSNALGSHLSRRAWQWLAPQLPRPGYFSGESWDDAEKLRRALVDAFLRYRWSPSLLADAVHDEQTRVWIERFCREFESGRELLRQAGVGSSLKLT